MGTRDSNESERDNHKATATEQGRPGGERNKVGAKNTTTSTKRNATKGRKGARGTRKNPKQAVKTIRKKTIRNAVMQHPDNRGIAKENPQHGREQEECQRRRAAGGAECRKTGTKTKENKERHKRPRVAEQDHKEHAEQPHAEKRRPKSKEKVEPLQEPQESNPTKKRNPEMPKNAGGASIP